MQKCLTLSWQNMVMSYQDHVVIPPGSEKSEARAERIARELGVVGGLAGPEAGGTQGAPSCDTFCQPKPVETCGNNWKWRRKLWGDLRLSWDDLFSEAEEFDRIFSNHLEEEILIRSLPGSVKVRNFRHPGTAQQHISSTTISQIFFENWWPAPQVRSSSPTNACASTPTSWVLRSHLRPSGSKLPVFWFEKNITELWKDAEKKQSPLFAFTWQSPEAWGLKRMPIPPLFLSWFPSRKLWNLMGRHDVKCIEKCIDQSTKASRNRHGTCCFRMLRRLICGSSNSRTSDYFKKVPRILSLSCTLCPDQYWTKQNHSGL